MPLLPILIIAAAVIWLYRYHGQLKEREAEAEIDRCDGCGYDLRETPTRCPECGRLSRRARIERLQTAWPAQPIDVRKPAESETWERVYTANHELEATLLQQHLEARGIAARVNSRATSYLLSGSYSPTHEVRELEVPVVDAEAARLALSRLLDEPEIE